MSDFTAENARSLKKYNKVNWALLHGLKDLIEEKAQYYDFVFIDMRTYSGGFSIEEVTDFLRLKGFRVSHKQLRNLYSSTIISW